MNNLKYACVGAGGIAVGKHLKGYSEVRGVDNVAVCDPDMDAARKAADEYGIPRVYADYEEMLENEKLDLISVCTPNFLHAPITLKALEKGINVHCEKPIALNSAEAQKMVDAKNRYDKKLMVALNNRFAESSLFVKNITSGGIVGEVYHVKCGWRRRRGIPGIGGWFTNKKLSGGGPLIDLGVHFLDLVMYFTGYPDPVSVTGRVYSKFNDTTDSKGVFDVEDLAVGFVTLENNATVALEFSWASNIEDEGQYYELLGTKGGVSFYSGELKVFSEMEGSLVDITPKLEYSHYKINEFEHFTDCIINDKEPMAPPEEAVKLMKIVDGIYRSSETGEQVLLRGNSDA